VPALAVLARDSNALSPARSTLAQLLHQAESLRREVEPLAANLARCDEVAAQADRALAERDRLLEEHDRAVADAIVHRRPRPDSMLVDDAEVSLRRAQTDFRAITRERERLNAELQSASERGSAIQREVAAIMADILVEAAIGAAETGYREAFRAMRKFERVVEGVYTHLKLNGQMHAVERLEIATRAIRAELAADKSIDIAAVQRFVTALATDPSAELEVE
jgi:hypothetical protein